MKFLTKKSNAYIWNMAGGMLYAFQSVILLMVITRTVDLYSAGIFTIAYASANLFLTIGKYGMRNYQVTDVVPKFDFREYRNSRIATIAFMIAVSAVYVVYKYAVDGYSTEKTVIVFVMCLLKSVDAAEDVYHGMYQQQGRLDIAAKLQTIRMVGTILSFAAGLIVFRNLLTALILATVVSAVLVFGLIAVTLPEFQDKTASSITGAEARKKTVGLLKICFPLFAGTFLSFYIGNAPKYAIDKLLSEEVQACYGFISMPVFVINLLNGFIYQPILNKLAVDWSMGKKADFIKKVVRQFACVVGITVAARGRWIPAWHPGIIHFVQYRPEGLPDGSDYSSSGRWYACTVWFPCDRPDDHEKTEKYHLRICADRSACVSVFGSICPQI